MEVTILYPFSTSEDNCDSFVKAIALARKKSAVSGIMLKGYVLALQL